MPSTPCVTEIERTRKLRLCPNISDDRPSRFRHCFFNLSLLSLFWHHLLHASCKSVSVFPCASCTLPPACHLPSSPTQSSEDMVRAMCHGQSSLQSPPLMCYQYGSRYANHGLEKHCQGNAVSFRRASLVGCFKGEGYSQLASALPLSGLVNILLALETVFPMSARERRLDFFVWCRCFLSSV